MTRNQTIEEAKIMMDPIVVGPTTDPRLVLEPAQGEASYGTINDRTEVNFGYEPSEIAG